LYRLWQTSLQAPSHRRMIVVLWGFRCFRLFLAQGNARVLRFCLSAGYLHAQQPTPLGLEWNVIRQVKQDSLFWENNARQQLKVEIGWKGRYKIDGSSDELKVCRVDVSTEIHVVWIITSQAPFVSLQLVPIKLVFNVVQSSKIHFSRMTIVTLPVLRGQTIRQTWCLCKDRQLTIEGRRRQSERKQWRVMQLMKI